MKPATKKKPKIVTEENNLYIHRDMISDELDDIKERVLGILDASYQFKPEELKKARFGLGQADDSPRPTYKRHLYCFIGEDIDFQAMGTLEQFAEDLGDGHGGPCEELCEDIEYFISLLQKKLAEIRKKMRP
jgi:hypothetical protein